LNYNAIKFLMSSITMTFREVAKYKNYLKNDFMLRRHKKGLG